jgi:hypothetical protein
MSLIVKRPELLSRRSVTARRRLFRPAPALNRPVNKHDLSTGETREFAGENVGSASTMAVECASQGCSLPTGEKRVVRNNVRNVADKRRLVPCRGRVFYPNFQSRTFFVLDCDTLLFCNSVASSSRTTFGRIFQEPPYRRHK